MSDVTDYDRETGEIVEPTANPVAALAQNAGLAVEFLRAEIDQQIATARALPRNMVNASRNIRALVEMDPLSAEECIYSLPRGGKPIIGPSIRLAEIIFSQWGNARIGTRVSHVDRREMFIEAEAVFHDLETNAAQTARVRRRISDKKSRLLTDDMIIVTGNAAQSIARRNAILAGIPKAIWRGSFDHALNIIRGDVKTLSERREKAFKAFAGFGVKPEQLLAALGLDVNAGIEAITIDNMPTLAGMHAALKNGEETVETLFRADRAGKPFERVGNVLKDDGAPKAVENKTAEGKPSPAEKTAQKVADGKVERKAPAAATEKPQDGEATTGGATVADNATTAASGAPAGADEGPSEADIVEAENAGREAFGKGRAKTSVPDRFKGAPTLAEAWVKGWTERHDERGE